MHRYSIIVIVAGIALCALTNEWYGILGFGILFVLSIISTYFSEQEVRRANEESQARHKASQSRPSVNSSEKQ